MVNYFVIRSKLNNLVLQIDHYNILKTHLGIQTEQFWVVTGQETQADNQLWTLTPQGQIQSKYNGLVLDIGVENLLDIFGKNDEGYRYLKTLGIRYPTLVAASPEGGKLAQQWMQGGLTINNNQNGNVLDILGSSLSEYSPITIASLSPDAHNQQWEFIAVSQPSPDPLPEPEPSPEPLPTGTRNTLYSGEVLKPGECLTSANGIYSFCYQANANLVLYENMEKPDKRVVWHSNSHLYPPAFQCHLQQSDGNLVVYNVPGHATWFAKKFGSQYPPSKLIVQNSGNVVIYDRNGTPYWDSLKDTGVSGSRD